MRSSLYFILSVLIFGFLSLSASGQEYIDGLKIKEYSKSVPNNISNSPIKLSIYLTENETSEKQKALNIYTWITHNIKYDIKQFRKVKTKSFTTKQTLRRKKGICYQYSDLFNALCRNAGIASMEIVGYSKGFLYDEGDVFYECDHSWNGVKIDSSWFLVDVTWGSGVLVQKRRWLSEKFYKWFKRSFIKDKYSFQQKADYQYFLKKPQELIIDHLPADPSWQLLQYPISTQTFENTRWKKYWDKPDSLYNSRIDSLQYIELLSKREKLSPYQYLALTGEKAHDFNPRNYKILAIPTIKGANIYSSRTEHPELKIRRNEESIKNYETAAKLATKHLKIIASESKKKGASIQRNIKVNLRQSSVSMLKSNGKQVSNLSRKFDRQERLIESQNSKMTKLKKSYDRASFPELTKRLNHKNLAQEDIQDINLKLTQTIDSVIDLSDSISVLISRIEGLTEKKVKFAHIRRLQEQQVNRSIQKGTSLIIENELYESLIRNEQKTDSISKAINSVKDSMQICVYEQSIVIRDIYKLQSVALKKWEEIRQLLNEKCSVSDGKDCDEKAYGNTEEKYAEIFRQKIVIQNILMDNMNEEHDNYAMLYDLFLQRNNLVKMHLNLISYLEKKKLTRIDFSKNKRSYEMNQLIKKSAKSVRVLNAKNRKLKAKLS